MGLTRFGYVGRPFDLIVGDVGQFEAIEARAIGSVAEHSYETVVATDSYVLQSGSC